VEGAQPQSRIRFFLYKNMAKRFTDSNKWKDVWFSNLPSKYKLFWIYITDECNHAGIWKVNLRLAEFLLNENLNITEIETHFKDRIEILDSENWFIPKFISFQYGVLNEKNRVHNSVLEILNNYKNKELIRPLQGAKDKYKDKYKDKDKEKDIPEIENFISYAVSKKENVNIESVKLKYHSWLELNWHDAKGNEIKNWKSKLLNTIPYLKENKVSGTKSSSIKNGINLENYMIPHSDWFGYQNDELLERCRTGKYNLK